MKILIDCDVGIDDAHAVMLARLLDDVEIVAITVVHGNSVADNCLANTKLLLDKLYSLDEPQPEIYLGAGKPILFNEAKGTYFGHDGFAGLAHGLYGKEIEEIKRNFIEELKQREHAAVKIVELVNKYPEEITILCLGPLTNLALALRLCHDPEGFCKKIKRLVIMGGNEPSAETKEDEQVKFIESNFLIDPVAAKVVIEEFTCPKTICTFQMTIRNFHKSIDMHKINELYDEYSAESPRCKFMQNIGVVFNDENKIIDYISCDYVAMLVALRNDECKTVYKTYRACTIDLRKHLGLILVSEESANKENDHIQFAVDIDQEIPNKYFVYCIQKMAEMDRCSKV